MKRNAWAIISGGILLPYTIRETRMQAMVDYCSWMKYPKMAPITGIGLPVFRMAFPDCEVKRVSIHWRVKP